MKISLKSLFFQFCKPIDNDVSKIFLDTKSVNEALRNMIHLLSHGRVTLAHYRGDVLEKLKEATK